MRATKRRDTKPERAVRSLLHAAGLRYRVDYRVGTGRGAPRPDIVFTRQRIAIFIDGCFWHRCPDHSTIPKSNRAFWEEKLLRNVARDRANDSTLTSLGWEVIRIWEHEAAPEAAARIIDAVKGGQAADAQTAAGRTPTPNT